MNFEEQKNLILQLKKELQELPKGELRAKISHGRPLFYMVVGENGKRKYKPINHKFNLSLRNQLRKKYCITKVIKDLESNDRALSEYKENYISVGDDRYIKSLLSSVPGAARLEDFSFNLNDILLNTSQHRGKVILYKGEVPNPEKRVLDTDLGFKVRSKSEVLISQALYNNGFTFAYEWPLEIEGITYFPDFTVFLSETNFVVWEHLGLTGDHGYNHKNSHKINAYLNHGLVFQRTLFITSENDDSALDFQSIKFVIDYLKMLISA